MRIYDNETSKIYSDLSPTATQEPQAFRFKKITETEAYLHDEFEICEQLAKKMKRFNTIISIMNTSLIRSTVIAGVVLLLHLQVVLACLLVLH